MKISKIDICRYSLVVMIISMIVQHFTNPDISVTVPILIALIGLVASSAAWRPKKSGDSTGDPED